MGEAPEDAIVAALWNLIRVVTFAVLVAETGRALVARYDAGSRGLERRALAGVAGFAALAGIPFVLALTCLVYVKWWVIAAVSALIIAWLRREWIEEWRESDRRRLSPHERALVAIALAIFVLYALRYESSHFYYGCLHSSVAWAIGEPIGHLATTPIERILFFHQDAQIGGTAIVAPFAAWMGPFGERILLGFAPAAIFLLTALTLRRLFDERTAIAASLVLVLCPWLLRLPQISVNVLAWLAGAAFVFLVVHRRIGWLAGIVCGLYVGVLYINVLAVPVFVWWAYCSGDRVRFRRFLSGLAMVGALLFVQNTIGHGSPLSYGSFRTVAEAGSEPFRYTLFGIEFTAHALFNWPLHDRVVRTPMNPMPVFLLLPMLGLRYFGILIAAIIPVGLRRAREADRVAFTAALAWGAIIAAVLLVQENWLQVEKAHTPFDAFPRSPCCSARGSTVCSASASDRGLRLGSRRRSCSSSSLTSRPGGMFRPTSGSTTCSQDFPGASRPTSRRSGRRGRDRACCPMSRRSLPLFGAACLGDSGATSRWRTRTNERNPRVRPCCVR